MNVPILLTVVIIAYLIGSISFARMIAQFANPAADLDQARTHISDTGEAGTVSGIGASTASMALGKKFGGIVAFLDMLKAFLPVIILRFAFPDQPYYLIFSIFVIIGHNYPIYYRFKGGRGLSPMLGSLLAIDPLGMIIAMVAGTLLAVFIDQPSASLILWFPILIIWSWLIRHNTTIAVYAVVLLFMFLIAEIPDIRLALQYQKQGRMDEYNRMIIESAPQTRMMKRLAIKIRFWDKRKNVSP
jgi:glycerol-3-phosphate acyltransferase PlsY